MGYEKGTNTREQLIENSKAIFNEQGLNVTLNNIASSLGITLGKLTYHFATKDLLFLAIAEEYEKKLSEIRSRDKLKTMSLSNLYQTTSLVMDLQYDYRCAMRYFASSSRKQLDLAAHTSKSFETRKVSIFNLLYTIVTLGELKISILEEEKFKVFLFAFTCLLTSWPVNLEIYDESDNYADMKPIYLKGIFSTFIPYLTAKGEDSMRDLGLLD
jgi:AcrR family transcriptional regulator